MFSSTPIAGKCVQGVFGPDQAVQKGCVEPKRQQGPFNTAEASRGAKAGSAACHDKFPGKASTPASKAASIKPSGVEPQPLVVSDVKLEDSQSPRSSRIGTRLCRSAYLRGDRLFSLAFRLLALSTVVGGAQASSDCGRFDSSKLKFQTFNPQVMNPDNYVGNMGIDLRSALDLFQNISTAFWDRYGPNRASLPTVSLADCVSLPEGLPDPDGWDPSSWVSLEPRHQYYQRAMDYSQSIAYAVCELITNATSATLNVNGTIVDDRYYGCGRDEFNATLPVNGTNSTGSGDLGAGGDDYSPIIMISMAFLVGLIANGYLSSKARQDVVNVIEQTENSHETQNFLSEAGENVKAFGDGQVPQGVSFALGNALGVSVALLANHLSSTPIDWGDKPWENEAFKNMVVTVGAQLIAEGVSLFTDKCGLGYSGGTMAGKPNQRQLQDNLNRFLKRTKSVLSYDPQFYTNQKTKEKVEALFSTRDVQNPILSAGGKHEHISRVVKAMLPEIVSLGGLVAVLQVTSNDWAEKAVFGGLEYVVGSAAVNAFASKCLGTGSVRSSMALEVLEIMERELDTKDLEAPPAAPADAPAAQDAPAAPAAPVAPVAPAADQADPSAPVAPAAQAAQAAQDAQDAPADTLNSIV